MNEIINDAFVQSVFGTFLLLVLSITLFKFIGDGMSWKEAIKGMKPVIVGLGTGVALITVLVLIMRH